MIRLIQPCLEYWTDYLKAADEFQRIETTGFILPRNMQRQDPRETLRRLQEMEQSRPLPPGLTPTSYYWLLNGSDFIGVGCLRHGLTDGLEKRGGHIGCAIRPALRNKGWGVKFLSLLLREAGRHGIKYALLTCDESDAASLKVMRKSGGRFCDTMDKTKRYFIDTKIAAPHWREPRFAFYPIQRIPGMEIDLVLEDTFPEDPAGYCPTYRFKICLSRTNIAIGYIDLRVGYDQEIYCSGNLGYHIDEKYRGHAYAAKAARILMPLVQTHHLNPLTITCNPDNIPSVKICERLGARYLELIQLPKGCDQYRQGDRLKRRYYLTDLARPLIFE
ncbi:MAG: GNAT family N-acetyltransferase [Clostridiales bacterium]|nr:GNAT family N-acetyltransferase [Clostridiales bacterium]